MNEKRPPQDKAEQIYAGISEVRDDLIEEASDLPLRATARRPWRKFAALAAALLLLIGGGAWGLRYLPGLGQNPPPSLNQPPSGEGGPESPADAPYLSYAGPLLPLTVLDPTPDLLAERHLELDFSPYSGDEYPARVLATDLYTLTNPTDEDITITVAYPWAGSLFDDQALLPRLTLDGEAADTTLYAGAYSGSFQGIGGDAATAEQSWNLAQAASFEDYQALLADGGYLAAALTGQPVLDQPVVVYELHQVASPIDRSAVNPTLAMTFPLDPEQTLALSYGAGRSYGYDMREGLSTYSFGISSPTQAGYGESSYIIVLGQDIDSYSTAVYPDGGCTPGDELAGCEVTVTRFESALEEALPILLASYQRNFAEIYGHTEPRVLGAVADELFLGCVKELLCGYGPLSSDPAERYQSGQLREIIDEAVIMERVLYITCELTIPAHSQAELAASLLWEASFDFQPAPLRNGYELATVLGSALDFTSQTLTVSHGEHIDISSQDLGLDPSSGQTTVELDMSQDRYWLEVRPLAEAE